MESKLKMKKRQNINSQLIEPMELHDWFIPSREIKIVPDKSGYWLFDNQRWIKETGTASERTKEIKPLKLGDNEFAKDFSGRHYKVRITIFKTQIRIGLYGTDWKGIINKETYPLFKHKSFRDGENGAIITPQMFGWLEDFGLIRTMKSG